MNLSDIFGYIAAILLPITLLPQLYLTYKTKKVDDISYIFICLQIVTCFFFLAFSILGDVKPILMANMLVLVELFILSFFKIKYTNKDNKNQINAI